MQICFFEDDLWSNFLPLTLTRPVDDLRLGILTIAEKWRQSLKGTSISRLARPELRTLFSHLELDKTQSSVWLNSRFIPSEPLVNVLKNLDKNTCIIQNDSIIAARIDSVITKTWIKNNHPDFDSLQKKEGENYQYISNLWDLFLLNEQEITADLERIGKPHTTNSAVSPHAILENEEQIYIEENTVIEPGAIVMANEGPVYIGENAKIMAGAVIQGPAAICRNSIINMRAIISDATTIGPVCKAGGEVKNSVLHSYSNKAHDGHLGNSLIGQWCNLGAGTNTSNLKNNYGHVRLADWQTGKKIETGQQFMGSVLGDHTKTAINTRLNSGTLCGVSCNIFSSGFPPLLIPSFSWVGSTTVQRYLFDKAIKTMQKTMARRDVAFTEGYSRLMRYVFEQR